MSCGNDIRREFTFEHGAEFAVKLLHFGLHTCYNGRYREQPLREQARIYKDGHSSDRSLQLDSVKLESLVIGYQP